MACIQCTKDSKITFRGVDYCWEHYDEASKPTPQVDLDDLYQDFPDGFGICLGCFTPTPEEIKLIKWIASNRLKIKE